MDCNKEEAVRAKALAENKLQSKDFQGARKIALKAQQLYSDLENISQMLMVCEIHCSAEKKLLGTELDWYGILQLEHTADEATIKKQYRKFALQLHPDKNKFPGAESAFKLVGEAQRVLLDREKRKMHDMKRNARQSTMGVRGAAFSSASAAYHAPPKGNSYATNGTENSFRGNFAGFNSQYTNAPPPQPGFSSCPPTFWTVCPFCSVRYQYYREIVNRSISCQKCKKIFVAYDVNVSVATPSVNADQPRFQKREPFPQHGYSKVDLGQKGASTAETRRPPEVLQKTAYQSAAASAYNVNSRKRRRGDDESSESTDSDDSTDSEEEEEIMTEDGHFQANQCSEPIRRSARQRQKVSYKDNFSDDDDDDKVVSPERVKENGQLSDKEEKKKSSLQEEDASKRTRLNGSDGSEERLRDDDSERDLNIESEGETGIYDNSYPELNKFDKKRQEGGFSVGQIWALKDSLEGVPRFYVQIRKVLSSCLKLKVTWLEPKPDKLHDRKWVTKNLPVSCGKFGLGKTEEINQVMLSHMMFFEKGIQNMLIIYPNVGETWAIFKNWDIKWCSDPDNHKKYEYEFVEILSEYKEKDGIQVAYLCKVKGFTSVFAQTSGDGSSSFRICSGELYRFSHRVPSLRLTSEEREGVPKGCFELDPACIPLSIEETDRSNNPDTVEGHVAAEGKSSQGDENVIQVSSESETHSPPGSSDAEAIDIPDSDFHNFDDRKSQENFQMGQVWALYCDEDSLPKYYALISEVNLSPQFKLQIQWLTGCLLPKGVTGWEYADMPNSCGKFKVHKGSKVTYTNTEAFSHRMNLEEQGKRGSFEILPNKGDIWALYRCWNCEMSSSDLEGCEYDLVEVIERNDSMVRVYCLERVDGFTSVFKCQLQGNSKVTQEIPMAELLRFSHQVPAVQLAEESNGSLRGCWDIDTAAMPIYFFRSK